MRVLILGSKGQLGRCLSDQLDSANLDLIFTNRFEIDVSDFLATKQAISAINPNVIINATAYTAVDKAEEDYKTASVINHYAVENIANICYELDILLVHISTDYIFDGASSVPYLEDDQKNPQGVYGHTKLLGEEAIQSSGCKFVILRTAWVFSEYGNNFLKTMLSLGSSRDELAVVDDQIGCPTYAQDIAKTISTILTNINSEERTSNIYHYCGDIACSWYDFAKAIFYEAAKLGCKIPTSITPIATAAYPTLAVRPANSVLDCSKLKSHLNVKPSDWHEGIRKTLLKI